MSAKIVVGAVVVVGVLFAGYMGYRYLTTKTLTNVTFTKNGEERCDSDGVNCKMWEFSTDETFENTDEWLFFKFNSGDVHRVIKQGTVCERVRVYGWRVPIMSWFRNIIEVENCK